MAAYRMNAYSVNFEYVYSLEETAMVTMFKSFEATGLRTFLSLLMVIYEDSSLDLYAHATITMDKMISYTLHWQTYMLDEMLFASKFSLPNEGLSDFSRVSSSDMKVRFSLADSVVSLSCKKKKMKMEFQVIMDLVSKALLSRLAGSFDSGTHERFLIMAVITSGTKMKWSTILFSVLVDMIIKHSIGFVFQISKMFSVMGVLVSADQDWTKMKMLDAENVLNLRPKISVLLLSSIKKELGEAQASSTKSKSKRKLILVSEFEQTTSEGSASHLILSPQRTSPGPSKLNSITKLLQLM